MVIGQMLTKMKEKRKTSKDGRAMSFGRNRSRSRSSRGSSSSGLAIEYAGTLNLLMLGSKSVGKTTICSRYVLDNIYGINNNFDGTELFESSVFLPTTTKEEKIKQYDLKITICEHRHEQRQSVELYKQQIQQSDGFLLVYAKDDRQSYMKLVELISDIRKIKQNTAPIVIIGNKADLALTYSHVQETIVLEGFAHFDVSAIENNGLQEVFRFLVQLCVERIS